MIRLNTTVAREHIQTLLHDTRHTLAHQHKPRHTKPSKTQATDWLTDCADILIAPMTLEKRQYDWLNLARYTRLRDNVKALTHMSIICGIALTSGAHTNKKNESATKLCLKLAPSIRIIRIIERTKLAAQCDAGWVQRPNAVSLQQQRVPFWSIEEIMVSISSVWSVPCKAQTTKGCTKATPKH